MLEIITRNAVPILDLFNQYVADLKVIFNGFELEEILDESLTIYITDNKNVKILVDKSNNNSLTVHQYCNDDHRIITYAYGNGYYVSYRMIKSDFGIAMSSVIAVNSSGNANSEWCHMSWFIGSGINVNNGSECIGVVTTDNDYRGDGKHSFYLATDLHGNIEKIDSNITLFKGTDASMIVLTPMFSYQYPFQFNNIYMKLQSQEQYGKLLIDNKKVISGTDFCLEYTD